MWPFSVSADGSVDPRVDPATGSPGQADSPVPILHSPREGTPDPLSTASGLAAAVAALAAGNGPVAVDAERASGYR